jgi:outer membrane protein OmpA-like peptidoglycan-associated protein
MNDRQSAQDSHSRSDIVSQLTPVFKVSSALTLALAISACQNLGGMNRQQVHVLKNQGFILTPDGWMLGLSEKLLFDNNEATLKPDTAQKITAVGRQLKHVNITHLKLNGYTDNTGLASYNSALSLKRAQAVADPLIQSGIAASDITTVGMGEAHPIASNTTEEGRSENRRVAIIVVP